jgi:hypothetical protein
MQISISSKTFDLSGSLLFDTLTDNGLGRMERRATKVAVFDGGVAVNDGGFSHGDRDMVFTYKPISTEHDDIARRLVQLHTRVYVSTYEGCFEAIPGPFDADPERNTFTLQIIQKVSEG